MDRDTTTGMTKEEEHLVDDAITKFIKRNIADIEFWLAFLGLRVLRPKHLSRGIPEDLSRCRRTGRYLG